MTECARRLGRGPFSQTANHLPEGSRLGDGAMFQIGVDPLAVTHRDNTEVGRQVAAGFASPSLACPLGFLVAVALGLAWIYGDDFVPEERHPLRTQGVDQGPALLARRPYALRQRPRHRCALGTPIRSARAQFVLDLGGSGLSAIARDGSTVAVENRDGTLTLRDGCAERIRAVLPRESGYHSLATFSRDGSTLAAASSDGVRLWESTTGRLRAELGFDLIRVTCVEFTPAIRNRNQ